MDKSIYLFIGLIALIVAVVTWILSEMVGMIILRNKLKVQQRLAGAPEPSRTGKEHRDLVITRPSVQSGTVSQWKPLSKFNIRLIQVYPETSLGRFAAIAACIGAAIFIIVGYITEWFLLGLLAGVAAVTILVVVINIQYLRRRGKMEDQLPDALDFLARVLRAGHSLSTGLRMVGQELPDPISTEFRRCYNQHSVGQSIEDTMKDLAARVQSPDFSFFVTAVLIQRQTGGNLAEVLDNIAEMVRARIRLEQKLKAITAEGRMTGYFLAAFPLFMFVMLYIMKPDYERMLVYDATGRVVALTVLGMQFLGLLVIRKIVDVKM